MRVAVPRGAEFLLSRLLELARIDGIPLTRRQVSLVYEPAGLGGLADAGELHPDAVADLDEASAGILAMFLAARQEDESPP